MDRLIEALLDPSCYPPPVASVEVVETHISWVLLAGDYAYKVKKPVRLAFLDFSTLAARRRFCEEELRLNRRTAPDLYLDVIPVTCGVDGRPAFGGDGETVEYALRMRRFAADALAEHLARAGTLDAAQVDEIGRAMAAFHAAAPRVASGDPWGSPTEVIGPALGNFDQIATHLPPGADAAALARLRAWTESEAASLSETFAERRAGGYVRECHGDLHLGNLAFLDGRAVPFDCIEFDPALRWIDVASEIAFTVMDLHAHGLPHAGARLLGAWLEASGDYGALPVLRFYLVYRAMVRAKIAGLRGAAEDFGRYVALAEALSREGRPALVLMHGMSGSGKTSLSQELLESLGAVRLRSDVERKRLHGLDDPLARTNAAVGEGLYGEAANLRTYDRLEALARGILAARWPVIVDAASLKRVERERFRSLARGLGVPFVLAACDASHSTLRNRVEGRRLQGRDASEADTAVLDRQRARVEPPAPEEAGDVVAVDTESEDGLRQGAARVLARLAAAAA